MKHNGHKKRINYTVNWRRCNSIHHHHQHPRHNLRPFTNNFSHVHLSSSPQPYLLSIAMCIKYLSSLLSYHCRRVYTCFFFLGQWMMTMGGKSVRMCVCLGNHVHMLLAYRKRSAHLALCITKTLITPRWVSNGWVESQTNGTPTCLFVSLFFWWVGCMDHYTPSPNLLHIM